MHVPSDAAELVMQLARGSRASVRSLIDEVEERRRKDAGARKSPGGGGREFHQAHNGPAPLSSGDKEGETIVRDTVEVLDKISEWKDVKVVPELSPHEKQKAWRRRGSTPRRWRSRGASNRRARRRSRAERSRRSRRAGEEALVKAGGAAAGGAAAGVAAGAAAGRWATARHGGGGGGGGREGGGGGGGGAPTPNATSVS